MEVEGVCGFCTLWDFSKLSLGRQHNYTIRSFPIQQYEPSFVSIKGL